MTLLRSIIKFKTGVFSDFDFRVRNYSIHFKFLRQTARRGHIPLQPP